MTHVGMKTMGPDCQCADCVVAEDNFDRDDEEIDAIDSTGNWSVEPDDSWEIDDNFLTSSGAAAGVNTAEWIGDPDALPAHIRIACDIEIGGLDRSAAIAYGGGGVVYRVYLKTIPELLAPCGVLRLTKNGVQVGWDVPVPDLVPGYFHRLTICYNPDWQQVTASVSIKVQHPDPEVELELGATHSAHWRDCEPPTGDEIKIWLEIPDESGSWIFDDFEISEIKQTGSYYYYDGTGDCPCCPGGGCNAETLTFGAEDMDCRWSEESGTWSQADGVVESSDAGARLLWNGSWTGIDSECLPDDTTLVEALFSSSEGGAEAEVFLDWEGGSYHHARLTLESAPGEADGSLRLFENGAEVDGSPLLELEFAVDVQHRLRLCFDGETLTAVAGTQHRIEKGDVGALGGQRAGIGVGSNKLVQFERVVIGHNIFAVGCKDCWGTVNDDGSVDPDDAIDAGPCDEEVAVCRDDLFPRALRVNFDVEFSMPVADVAENCCLNLQNFMAGTLIIRDIGEFWNGPACFEGSTAACGPVYSYGVLQCFIPDPALALFFFRIHVGFRRWGEQYRIHALVEVYSHTNVVQLHELRSELIDLSEDGADCLTSIDEWLDLCAESPLSIVEEYFCIVPGTMRMRVRNI